MGRGPWSAASVRQTSCLSPQPTPGPSAPHPRHQDIRRWKHGRGQRDGLSGWKDGGGPGAGRPGWKGSGEPRARRLGVIESPALVAGNRIGRWEGRFHCRRILFVCLFYKSLLFGIPFISLKESKVPTQYLACASIDFPTAQNTHFASCLKNHL